MNEKNVVVQVVELEDRGITTAKLRLQSRKLRGRVRMFGNATIKRHVFRLVAVHETDGSYRETVMAEKHNGNRRTPYTLANQPVEEEFQLGPFDIGATMRAMSLDPVDAVQNTDVRIELEVEAKVHGGSRGATTRHVMPIRQ